MVFFQNHQMNLYNLNNQQIQRLQKVIYENKKLLSDEMAALNALENYVRSQSGSCVPSRTVYSRQCQY